MINRLPSAPHLGKRARGGYPGGPLGFAGQGGYPDLPPYGGMGMGYPMGGVNPEGRMSD